jgi:hypothetical protein
VHLADAKIASLIVVSPWRRNHLDRDDLAAVVSIVAAADWDFERNLAVKAGLAITSIEQLSNGGDARGLTARFDC